MTTSRRRAGTAVIVVLALCIIGEIAAVELITDDRISCGSQIDQLVQLTCHNITYPHRGAGVVLAIVSAVVAVTVVAAWTVITRRERAPISD